MNRGGVHHNHHHRRRRRQQQQQHESSLVQQMMIGSSPSPSFWSMNELMMMPPQEMPNLSSSKEFPKFLKALSPKIPCHDQRSQELPESWSQLLLGNLVEEEGECTYAPIFESSTNLQNLVDHVLKEDISYCGNFEEHHQEDEQGTSRSPRSCVTTSFSNNNILDFSNSSKAAQRKQNHQADHHHLSPDQNFNAKWNGNSGGPSFKKARVQASSVVSSLKVRTEKLGDRIAALHQLVSPFGKTDTASVLLETIGYIRFLHGQIQALSSPYIGKASRDSTSSHGSYHQVDDGDQEGGKDLRSRGLCLAPASFTLQVDQKDIAASFWAHN
ncbi:transcription factor bHLH68-like [Zingiber officinale]|uniref:transcription factor bHLH68-like n=1 Tax=Zingiber officinale TaxID=94328 RepID=UPI001C4B22A7|nr:transcription factor bHLH68-like [Zingiber officinale]